MDIVFGHKKVQPGPVSPGATLAIGNFDGVHLGHAHIFHQTLRIAREHGGTPAVLTFQPHPAKVLAPAFAPPLITSLDRKLELIAAEGIALTVVEPFDHALARLTPEEFVTQVLSTGIGAKHLCVGHDFTFGNQRAGTASQLAALGRARGIELTVVPPFSVDGLVCSSTKVREFVLEGRVDGARLLLGRDFEVQGEVVRGAGRGRTIGIPTANVHPDADLVPGRGVYAGWAEVVGQSGRTIAAINVGNNPTFGENNTSVEAHLLDFNRDLYGQRLRLGFHSQLRAEKRFMSVEALIEQIRKDIDETRRIHDSR